MSHVDRVILLTNYFVYLYTKDGGKYVREAAIKLSEGSVEKLRGQLEKGYKIATRIIVNVLEEEYVFEHLPYAAGADGKQMIQRKLNQHFRQSAFKQSVVQGRQKNGRRDQEVMFTSLGNCEDLKALVDMMFELEIPITGIYSAPQLCRHYLAPVLNRENVLVMTEIDNGVLEKVAVRQSFFHDGKLRLTRVGMIDVLDSEQVHHDVEESLESSRRYLLREKLLSPQDKLDVVFVSSTKYLESLEGYSEEALSHFSFNHIKTQSIADYIDVPTDAENGFEDVIAACAPPLFSKPHYVSGKSGYFQKYRSVKNWSLGASAAAAVAMFGLSGVVTYKSLVISDQLVVKNEKLYALQEKVNQLREASALHVDQYDIYQVKDAVDVTGEIRDNNSEVIDIYRLFSAVLADYPSISVKGLSWNTTELDTSQGDADMDSMFDAEGFPLEMDNEVSKQPVVVAKLLGKYLPTQSASNISVRDMLGELDSFAASFTALNGVRGASYIKMPVAIQPDEALSGQIVRDADNSELSEKTFELEVVVSYANG